MKEIVEFLRHKKLLFKSLKPVSPKEIGSRKKITIFVGVDLKGYYAAVMVLRKKSRVLRKEAEELMQLHEKLERYVDSTIPKKYIVIHAPLCSKARALLEENGWTVFVPLAQSEE